METVQPMERPTMKTPFRIRRFLPAVLVLLSPGAPAAGISVFSDDFATSQTLAEHWRADGEIRSEGGRLVVSPGAKATWRGAVPEKYVLEWVEGEERAPRREERERAKSPAVVFEARGAAPRLVDDVVVSLPEDADASPNLIVNSGFEFDEDGVPPYFCNRGAFDWRHYGGAEYGVDEGLRGRRRGEALGRAVVPPRGAAVLRERVVLPVAHGDAQGRARRVHGLDEGGVRRYGGRGLARCRRCILRQLGHDRPEEGRNG